MLNRLNQRMPELGCRELPGEKHSGAGRIPHEHRHKRIIVNVRDVFDHYVSRYTFRWWADPRRAKNRFDMDCVLRDYPTFPDLSFSEFLHLFNHWHYRRVREPKQHAQHRSLENLEIGHNSHTLLRMTQTRGVMKFVHSFDALTNEQLNKHFAHVHFLRTETLNDDLAEFLEGIGVPHEELESVRRSERILPKRGGRGKAENWQDYFSDDDVRFILHRDRLYLRLFPDMVPEDHTETESSQQDTERDDKRFL